MCYKLNQLVLALVVLASGTAAMADVFGTGANQFTIEFVTISGVTNPTSGYGIVNNDYRMGTYKITNDQWNKFANSLGVPVTGSPSNAYSSSPYYTGANVPTNYVSWYEAAQFVNWLNTSAGHHAAYNFTDTQGTSNYAFATWSTAEAANGTNVYRHKDAFYYLPMEDEWTKAAYWNGTALQTYATKVAESLTQGDGTSGSGWNYYAINYATNPPGPWDVGSGSQELNGTYDMMGNVGEWMESPFGDTSYGVSSSRGVRGGSFVDGSYCLASSDRSGGDPALENYNIGFRVASVPEPGSLALLPGIALMALLYWWRKRA